MSEPYHDYKPAGKQNFSMARQFADALDCWLAGNTECKLAGRTVSRTANQTAGRLTSWHDGRPARRQDFTVKKRPKHCIGETSEHFLSLAGRSTIGALNIPESRADAGLRAAMPLPVSGAQVEKASRALAMPTTVVAVLAGVLAVEVAEDWLEYLHHGRSGHDAHADYRDLVEHGSLAA